MKKANAAGGILALFILGYLWGLPYMAVMNIAGAIVNNDPQGLDDRVDFPALKQNLKGQIHAFLAKNAVSGSGSGSSSAPGKMIGSSMIDAIIDSGLNPSTVILLANQAGDFSSRKEQLKSPWRRAAAIFSGGRYGYGSPTIFSYWLPTEQGEVRFELSRSGFHWKLTNAVIPVGYFNYLQDWIPRRK